MPSNRLGYRSPTRSVARSDWYPGSEQMTPNLFDYATKELSQDAFFCWLLAWADEECRDADSTLHALGAARQSG